MGALGRRPAALPARAWAWALWWPALADAGLLWRRSIRLQANAATAWRRAPDAGFFADGPEDSDDSEARVTGEAAGPEVDRGARPAPPAPEAPAMAPSPKAPPRAPCPPDGPGGLPEEPVLYLLKTGAGSIWKAKVAQDTWVRAVGPEDRVAWLCDEDCPRDPPLESLLVVPTKSLWPECRIDGHLCSFYHLLPLKVGMGLVAAVRLATEGSGRAPGWYVVGDDDTFFVPSHVRRALKRYSPDTPVMLGEKAQAGYYGGGGWAMSRAAVELFQATYDEYRAGAMSNIARNFVYDDILVPEHIFANARKAGVASRRDEVFVDAPEFCASPPADAEAGSEPIRVPVLVPARDGETTLLQAGRACNSRCPASFHLKGNMSQELQWSHELAASELDQSGDSRGGSWRLVEGRMCVEGSARGGNDGNGWPVSLRRC